MSDGIYKFEPVLIEVFDTEVFCINEEVALAFLSDLEEDITANHGEMENDFAFEPVYIALNPKEAMQQFLSQVCK